ncbi:hypothetical protein ACMTAU_22130, partial [Alcaligenes pakistanensis]
VHNLLVNPHVNISYADP